MNGDAAEKGQTQRTSLVTGGNRGIGFAVCEALARLGHRVIVASRDPDEGDAAAERLETMGAEALAVELDLASPASVGACLESLARAGVEVDVLVNNAGVYPRGDLLDLPIEDILDAMAVHVFGPLELTRGLVPDMRRRGYGRIVNVSSGLGAISEGLRGGGAYSLSKAALNAMTIRLARELEGTNVKVNAVSPGWVRTRMGGEGAPRAPEEAADGIVWCATLPDDGPTGGFFRDRKPVPW